MDSSIDPLDQQVKAEDASGDPTPQGGEISERSAKNRLPIMSLRAIASYDELAGEIFRPIEHDIRRSSSLGLIVAVFDRSTLNGMESRPICARNLPASYPHPARTLTEP
ncbi:MAG: hypothetical protein EAZ61_10610 [Oscillatoriales cyanobacterium]|nr:MAG: hypothetical protein EAZ61_10610 [Oscillatoriales cyanobacterium]